MEERHGEKRPRDEHTWTEERCLVCKTRSKSYPVLHPDCHHPYCAACVMKKESKACDLCTNPWVRMFRAFTPSPGVVIVAEFCADCTVCLSKHIHVFGTNFRSDIKFNRYCSKTFAKEREEFRPFLYENGILPPKLFPARVAKHGSRIGPGARVVTYDDDEALVYSPLCNSLSHDGLPDHLNAVYVTKHRKYQFWYNNQTQMIKTRGSAPVRYLNRIAGAFALESGLLVDDYVNSAMLDDRI